MFIYYPKWSDGKRTFQLFKPNDYEKSGLIPPGPKALQVKNRFNEITEVPHAFIRRLNQIWDIKMRLERSSRDPFSSCVLSQSISLELSSCRQCGGCFGSTTPPPSPLSKSSLFSGQHEDNPDSLTSIVPPVSVCSRSCHQLHSSFSFHIFPVQFQHSTHFIKQPPGTTAWCKGFRTRVALGNMGIESMARAVTSVSH